MSTAHGINAAKRKLIERMLSAGALLFGRFVLTSGRESDYYINVKKLVTDPGSLALIAEMIEALTAGDGIRFDRVAGPELGAVPIATAVSLRTGKPLVIIRKRPKSHGTGSLVEGEVRAGESVLIVEDVTTTGGSVLRAAEVVEELGGKVSAISVVVDRGEGAAERIRERGYTFLPLIHVSELLEQKVNTGGEPTP
ncbi:orotate phosphoribosyltransferase [Thermococcus sp.]|uniref:orotate phosphoribosyltransferase n=1 Tax=Thermococcus sp. TaxID=35749 RepID=UPI0026220444|nr:orotate phosphoribosyltransferase [Thermococcus sp.]